MTSKGVARRREDDTGNWPEEGAQGRLSQRRPVAVVDIGSNSVRQVIYEGLTRSPAVLFNEKVLCGLGQGIATTGRLNEQAVERAIAALRRFHALGRQAGVSQTHILATAAAREASNGPQFITRVEEMFGTDVMVLTGMMEAQYSAYGIKSGFHEPEGIVGDMGGGSLELVGVNGEIKGGITLPLGGLRLAEMSGGSIEKARDIIKAEMARISVAWPGTQRNFYAVGGTWRSLVKLHIARTHYPLMAVHDYHVPAKSFLAFCNRLAGEPIDTVVGIDAVSRNRRALLPYGALVMAQVLKTLKADMVIASSLGVREGYLYSLLPPEEQAKDSLLETARDLSILRARSPRHAQELADWSTMAFATLGTDETADETRYRIASCYLADIAWRAHPDFRAQQSLSVIANTGFVGISHEGRAYLALSNFHRYQGLGSKVKQPEIASMATPRIFTRARLLAAIFRVLYLYSASMAGVIPRLGLVARDDDSFVLTVPRDISDLCGERPEERLSQLARETGKTITMEIV